MAISKDDFQLYFLLALIGTFAVLSFVVFLPYLLYIIGGIILVYISYPLYKRIQLTLHNKSVAAAICIVILLLATVIPMLFLVWTTVLQAQVLLTQVGTELPQFIDTTALEVQIQQITGQPVDIDEVIRSTAVDIANSLSTELPGLIQTAADVIIGIVLMGFTMYYLFKDGDHLIHSVTHLLPLRATHKETLLAEADRMAEAILVGHLLTAAIQGIIAGIGLLIVGIPNVIFWTFVMILLGLVPIIGSFVVWGPAGAYLIFVKADPLAGAALLLYGATVVSFTDNIVRAKFVESRANIHPLVVLIGVIGAIPVFGLLGVVLGPLILGFFIALLRVYSTDFWGTPAEETI